MKKVLLIMTLLGLTAACTNADPLTIEEWNSRPYLENSGYSASTVDLIERSRARARGEEYVQAVEHPIYENKPVKWVRKFWMYVDPGLDNGSFMGHDNHSSTNINDL